MCISYFTEINGTKSSDCLTTEHDDLFASSAPLPSSCSDPLDYNRLLSLKTLLSHLDSFICYPPATAVTSSYPYTNRKPVPSAPAAYEFFQQPSATAYEILLQLHIEFQVVEPTIE